MSVKNAARKVAKKKDVKKIKTNRTLSLDHENFEALMRHCAGEGRKASNVIDELIEAYLHETGS